ncbi:serpin family protein [bacterium]|nr:serpin family protein [bacterium]
MKKIMTIFAVLAMVFFVSCSNSLENKETVDTGDTSADKTDTDTGDTDTDPADTGDTDTAEPTNPTEPTDDPTEEVSWEAKYKKADGHAENVSADVVKANNDLGMKIFSKLAAAEAGRNMMISPLSISIAMAMVTNGASDENLDEMKEVLGFGEMELGSVNEQFMQLIASLVEADKDMVLEIADSVWMDDVFAPDVKQDFIDVLKEFYDAAFFTEDFQDETTAGKINSWVSEKTHEKIDKIIDQIAPNTIMYLINAIYFKAAWTTSFDKESTYEGVFMLSDGSEGKADYMGFSYDQKVPEFFSYSSDWGDENGYSVVRIPYGRGVFAFYGIVPNPDNKTNIDDFIEKIAEDGFDSYISQLEERDFHVQLPKFKFAYDKSLVDVFKSLGMEKAFEEGALMNIAGEPHAPFISDIYHKTFVEVNEAGTEAAAVTVVEVGENAMPSGFYANRPFVFVIRDDRTGSVLFIGKVENPKAE